MSAFSHIPKVVRDCDPEDAPYPDEMQALEEYLAGNIKPEEAAERITKPTSLSTNPEHDLPRLYGLLQDCLSELSSSATTSLLKLIRAIEALPPPDFSRVPKSDRPAHGQLWRGLPGFGHGWADDYPSLEHWLDSGGLSKPAEEREQFLARQVRRAEVEARLAQEGLASIPLDWGYERVADALERSQAVLEAEVPMACKWIEYAGDAFREGADKGEESWALRRERDLWTGGERGKMSVERWKFWVKRLQELESDEKEGGPERKRRC
ncbi:hypothetical protein F5Y15DRAFT_380968 [Xylariaceae sp. FL0016]|nr:hypothetical protein F5Y15DRAFT_380968 [Xylariaceae sp. FL0016]